MPQRVATECLPPVAGVHNLARPLGIEDQDKEEREAKEGSEGVPLEQGEEAVLLLARAHRVGERVPLHRELLHPLVHARALVGEPKDGPLVVARASGKGVWVRGHRHGGRRLEILDPGVAPPRRFSLGFLRHALHHRLALEAHLPLAQTTLLPVEGPCSGLGCARRFGSRPRGQVGACVPIDGRARVRAAGAQRG